MLLETIFEGAAEWLTNSAVGFIKKEWDRFNWAEAAARYGQRLREQHDRFKPLGRSESIPLADIFTEVYMLDQITARQLYGMEEVKKQFPPDGRTRSRPTDRRHNGLEVARQNPRLYLLGHPGAGKTTFLRYLTLKTLSGHLENIVPIFVSLHGWSKSGLGLMEFIDREFEICAFPRPRPFVEYLLQSGRALALFDGLDEVSHDKQDLIITDLRDFSRRYSASRMVITCRIAAARYSFENFNDMALADFDEKQIKTYARRWFHREPETAKNFLDELYRPDNAGIRELAAVPIMLNLLCLTFEAAYRLPQRRSELYERAITTLLEHWDASRRIDRAKTQAYEPYRQLSTAHKKRLFARIAAETFKTEDFFWPRARLEADIVKAVSRLPNLGPQADGGAILRAIAGHHGLFIERAADIYSFAHLSFHEYFAACFIVENEARGTLKQLLTPARITDPRWREVLLLTAEMLTEADDFFSLFQQAIAALLTADPALTYMVVWVADRAAAAFPLSLKERGLEGEVPPPANPAALRAFYFFLARTRALARIRDLDLNLDLNRTCALAFDLTLTLDSTLNLDRNRVLDRYLARDLNLNLDFSLDDDLTRTFGPDSALDGGLITAWLASRIFVEYAYNQDIQVQVSQLIPYKANLVKLSLELDNPLLTTALTDLTIPSFTDSPRKWAAFNDTLAHLMQTHRDLREWKLTEKQAGQLARYFEANRLLVQCLERADVANREEIKRGLLLV